MFLGTHTPKVDEKGRFFLPAKFRDELGDGLVITKGMDHSLVIYPTAEFMKMAIQAQSAPATLKGARGYQRVLAAAASEETPDKQGRVTIPPMLRAYAGLDKEIAVIGAIDRVEIWDLARWLAYEAEQDEIYANMDGRPDEGDA